MPTKPASGLRELLRLTGIHPEADIHEFTAPIASLAHESDTETSLELHRYEVLFGRDALRIGMDVLPLYPQLTRATLLELARLQGAENISEREEEPGRIPHEVRRVDDPIALQLTEEFGWGWPYYGSVDATPEFIRTTATYCNKAPEGIDFLRQPFTNKEGYETTMENSLISAVDWVLRRLHSNKEGLLEFKAAIPKGIENQVWKDSWDSYFHKDGKLANHEKGIASIEVQRIAYDALLDAADLYTDPILAQPEFAIELRVTAAHLKKAIFKHFWTDDEGGYFVLGTDRNDDDSLNQLKIKTSNMGHVLNSRLLEGDEPEIVHMREAVIRQLFSPEMLTPFGIRTLASDEIRYRPGAYHNGSIWLWDTNMTNRGLRRHGYFALSNHLSRGLLNIINATRGFPEFIRGDALDEPTLNTKIVDVWDDTYQRKNRVEQPPQQVQGWSVGTALDLKRFNRLRHGQPKQKPNQFEQSIFDTIVT